MKYIKILIIITALLLNLKNVSKGEISYSALNTYSPAVDPNSPLGVNDIMIVTSLTNDEVFTGVEQTSVEIPKRFYLGQNYPNPFNPETNIYFSLPEGSNVKLSITDVTGGEISTIVNEYLSAGTYKVNYSGNSLSSGTYFYMMQSGNFISVKKMVLVK
ncbi:MAG TPA: T9SS type A sorting domain-containing protein [Ignavibacteria bacterium]|jgi:hypothetical protein